MFRYGIIILILAAWFGPATDPWVSVQRGNTALAQGDVAAALAALEHAELLIDDPGIVAFNRGVAYYRKGDFPSSEQHFRLAATDAEGSRRLFALYNLANALQRQAGVRDLVRLEEAVHLYRKILGESKGEFADTVRHNLELAKQLLSRARARADESKDQRPPEEERPRPEERPPGSPESGGGEGSKGERRPARQEGQIKANATDDPPGPGKGELPIVPDRSEPVSMPPEAARRHLLEAARRVLDEGRSHRQRSVRAPSGKVRDW